MKAKMSIILKQFSILLLIFLFSQCSNDTSEKKNTFSKNDKSITVKTEVFTSKDQSNESAMLNYLNLSRYNPNYSNIRKDLSLAVLPYNDYHFIEFYKTPEDIDLLLGMYVRSVERHKKFYVDSIQPTNKYDLYKKHYTFYSPSEFKLWLEDAKKSYDIIIQQDIKTHYEKKLKELKEHEKKALNELKNE